MYMLSLCMYSPRKDSSFTCMKRALVKHSAEAPGPWKIAPQTTQCLERCSDWPMPSGCSRFPAHHHSSIHAVSGLEDQWVAVISGSSISQQQAWKWEELCQTSFSHHPQGFTFTVSSVLNFFQPGRSKGVARTLSDMIICFVFLLENGQSSHRDAPH